MEEDKSKVHLKSKFSNHCLHYLRLTRIIQQSYHDRKTYLVEYISQLVSAQEHADLEWWFHVVTEWNGRVIQARPIEVQIDNRCTLDWMGRETGDLILQS